MLKMKKVCQEEFEEILNSVINKHPDRRQFGIVGVVGSGYGHKLHHDLDVIFYPSDNSVKGKFVSAQMEVIEELQKVLRTEQGTDLIPFPMLELQGVIEAYSGRKEGEILMHNLIFADMDAIKQRVPFFEKWMSNIRVIYGSEDAFKEKHLTDLDYYYFTMVNAQTLLSRLPEKAVDYQARTICNYVNEYMKNNRLLVPDNKKLSREQAIELYKITLQELDKKAKFVC
jgi:hypothetical protein